MDALLLEAVVAEVAARLVEQEILRVSFLGASRYLIRFASTARDNLLISIRPELPRFHLVAAGPRIREEGPDRCAALLDQELAGAVLTSLSRKPDDRIVTLRFRTPRRDDQATERRLVVELLGRSANLLLLDAEGRILGAGREMRDASRPCEAGATYHPPPGRDAYAGLTLAPASLSAIRERFADPADFLAPLCPSLARDLRGTGGSVEGSWERLAEILKTVATGSWTPVVYSRHPLAEIGEAERIGRDDLVVCALPLRAGLPEAPGGDSPIVVTSFSSPSEAVEAGLGLLERARDFQAKREKHLALVRREIERLLTLVGKLEAERARAEESDRYRLHAEALLAGLGTATIAAGAARVPDPYGEPGATIAVPIDPALSLQDNAQALFDRYKKGKRGLLAVGTRLAAAGERLSAWRQLLPQAEQVKQESGLEMLRTAMERLGLMHAPPPRAPGAAPRRGEVALARVRRHTSRDGMVILVGKSGEENDTLTFKIAAPWDFWLHAAGRPGAHVVVRNPQRLKAIPDATLREAAAIAAFYSGARAETRVEVHYTQRKHVRKVRGMPSGQVLLRRFRSIEVAPRLPASSLEDV